MKRRGLVAVVAVMLGLSTIPAIAAAGTCGGFGFHGDLGNHDDAWFHVHYCATFDDKIWIPYYEPGDVNPQTSCVDPAGTGECVPIPKNVLGWVELNKKETWVAQFEHHEHAHLNEGNIIDDLCTPAPSVCDGGVGIGPDGTNQPNTGDPAFHLSGLVFDGSSRSVDGVILEVEGTPIMFDYNGG